MQGEVEQLKKENKELKNKVSHTLNLLSKILSRLGVII